MKRHPKMLLLALLVIIPLAFSGCDIITGFMSPWVGSWAGSMYMSSDNSLIGSGTFVIHSDNTFDFTYEPFVPAVKGAKGSGVVIGLGTYSTETSANHMTFTFTSLSAPDAGPVVDTPYVMGYELTESNSVLTLTDSVNGAYWLLEKQ
jgi:hypothetical protein